MFSTHQHPPPPIPPSPTLSNPDMILPFDENERENSTPSPPFNLPSLSNLQSFYETRTSTNYSNGYSLDPTRSHNSGAGAAPRAQQQKKGYPRHTWTHENLDAASRRLSDIGEEDYNTSSSPFRHGGRGAGMRTTRVMIPQQDSGSAQASPVSVREATAVREPETRTNSSSSNSTISGASETSSWDGTKGRAAYVVSQESRGTGSDRRATAAAVAPMRPNGAQASSANAPPANDEKGGPDEDLSSAILSSEAERILENAKKRLSLMEGNLTRARSSMRASTPSSPSPAPSASAGLGQPVGGLYQSIHRVADRRSSLRPRQTQDNSNRHSRVYSETSIPSNQPNHEANQSRSVSAMGSSTSSTFYTDDRSFHYAPNRAYLTHRASVSSMQQVSANGLPTRNDRSSSDSPRTSEFEEEIKISNIDDFNSAYPVLDPPSRSQSQLQVRDLQDQMKGLHIKISTLKVKAQEDNLRRRSLQSLRTPSPLTAANHWYANPLDPTERRSHLHPSAGYQHVESPRSSQGSGSNNTDSTLLVPETVHSEGRVSSDGAILPPFELTDHEDGHSTSESLYEDAEEGDQGEIDRKALEEILREPLDDDLADSPLEAFPSVPHHDDTPHEEREDAFDYEHFILHSALGNYTQARLHRQSDASDTSVETTRPIRERRSTRHSRSSSTNSISTVATFATAAEGRDDIESVLYWDRKFNDELNHSYAEDTESNSETSLRTPRKSRVEDLASQRPDSAATGSATPTSLASSLVSTVRAAASPYPNAPNGNLGINEDDTRLLEQLFKSLGDVCMELQELTTSPDYDEKQAKLLRRRLEAARRVLDGELD
ncbi:hypothetical protein ASPCAL08856 [Aspergillus calidoustus]|uniref:Uncharacterized protein n=1 Tax=Aspergillus calidoustus TaxID=454130 RepID=A0A0U5GT75_ASPCI|nr:hypothetical protein ASPCAL08856 [Aspergillus calidoustus]